MQLFVQSQDIHTLDVSEETLVSEIKETVSDLEDIPAGELVAYYGGLPLDDDSFVCEAVPESGTVNVSMRLLGGKVHGSLARAGKVRGQTPKVDPQEKKKKKTGRAKRRMQYNRRFVNVVATFGRKRGPNSNA